MTQTPKDILELTSEAAVLVHSGRAVFANHAARAVLGEGCVGKPISELFGEDVAGTQASSFLAQLRFHGAPYTVRISRSGGDQVYFLRPQEPYPAILNQPFLYNLRSALMNMTVSTDRIRDISEDLQNAALLDSLRTLTRGEYRILRMVNNASLILDAAEGSPVCVPRVFNLSALYGSLLEAVRGLMPGLCLRTQLGKDISIFADPALMKSLLLNLLSNAILHARGCTRIAVSLTETAQSVVLAVDDDGCGIPPEALYEVFDRYRHSFDLTQMSAGPGLGLTAVRLITQLHGGTLLLESRPGQGTTLRASLSKGGLDQMRLGAAINAPDCETRDLLIGLADCLPLEAFSERYLS